MGFVLFFIGVLVVAAGLGWLVDRSRGRTPGRSRAAGGWYGAGDSGGYGGYGGAGGHGGGHCGDGGGFGGGDGGGGGGGDGGGGC
jgi:hypothetical protein